MKKYEISQLEYHKHDFFGAGFEIVINDDDKEKYSINDVKELAKWCSQNFKNNYILNGTQSEILSGGTSDNKKMWWRPHTSLVNIKYILKCHPDDAVLFKLTWMINNFN